MPSLDDPPPRRLPAGDAGASIVAVTPPEIRYAWNGEIALAYQVVGDGPLDLLYLQGDISNIEVNWEHPGLARFLRELARLSRLIVSDRRGLGCSERFTPADTPPIETLMDDIIAVLDAAGSERPVLLATGNCGFVACPFAATRPDRLAGLILFNAAPSWRRSSQTPWGRTDEELERSFRWVQANLGNGSWSRRADPSLAADERELRWFARYERMAQAPGALYSEARRFAETDVRNVLPSIQIPTLVLHRVYSTEDPIGAGRYLAAHIPGARLSELPGADHFPWVGNQDPVIREVERFLTTIREEEAELDRVLATILFTDIVGSTEKAAALGDQRWRGLLARHDSTVRALVTRYRGTEINTTGDGFFATFDGPARAVRCARAIVEAVKPLGVEVRAGLHTGEITTREGEVGGLAVHIGARVGALAGASEVLVSHTLKDLVAGSGLAFEDRGAHRLKGVPDEWRLFAAGPTARDG
jgi:class 3 adenylate cyclase/pimeloyl-ACP methyl ester carboxylesterase